MIANFLNDFLNTPRSGLLSFGFVVAVFYASNAVMALMRSFNRSLAFLQGKRDL
jgi:membrane protein